MSRKNDEHVIFKSKISDIDEGGAACATDCTGLIPSDPKSDAERKSYEEICNYSADEMKCNEKRKS